MADPILILASSGIISMAVIYVFMVTSKPFRESEKRRKEQCLIK